MNWMLIAVLAVLILSCLFGIKKGLIRVVYSLVVGIVLIFALGIVTPKVTMWVKDTTKMDEKMSAEYERIIEKKVEEAIGVGEPLENPEQLEEVGIHIPKFVLDKAGKIKDTAGTAVEEIGVYGKLATTLTDYTIFGIVLLVLGILFIILYAVLERVLNIISKLPVIHQANALGGGIIGLIDGFLLVWLAFGIITLFSGTPAGLVCNEQIQDSSILTWIYDNNLLLKLVMLFL